MPIFHHQRRAFSMQFSLSLFALLFCCFTVAKAETAASNPTSSTRSASPTPRAAAKTPTSVATPTVSSTSTASLTPTATPTPTPVLPARGTLEIAGDVQKMSVFAVGTDAQELLTAVADRAKMAMLIDDTVSRKLTVNFVDRPARQIIHDIARAYGLSAAEVNGVMMISEGIPRSAGSYLLSEIDSIPTKYVDAANARNLLPVFLQDYVKVNSEQNSVVLSAPREVLDKFRQDIAQFDIPASQILLDLLLVELTDSKTDDLGLQLSYANNGNGISLLPGTGTSSFSAITTLRNGFFVQLSALQKQGKARVRANPRIATVSGRAASIFVGRQQYVLTPLDNGSNNISAGVQLNVTPYTGGQKQVLINAYAEVSTLSAPDATTRLPEKSTRTANTTVRVNDGQTIVIGGLKQQETRDIRTRVPFFGDLPLIGKLFRTRSVGATNTELVLFITPHILSDTGHLPAEVEKEMRDRFLNGDLSAPMPPPAPSTFDLPKSLQSANGNGRSSTRSDVKTAQP